MELGKFQLIQRYRQWPYELAMNNWDNIDKLTMWSSAIQSNTNQYNNKLKLTWHEEALASSLVTQVPKDQVTHGNNQVSGCHYCPLLKIKKTFDADKISRKAQAPLSLKFIVTSKHKPFVILRHGHYVTIKMESCLIIEFLIGLGQLEKGKSVECFPPC